MRILVLITLVSSQDSDEHGHQHSITKALAAHIHNVDGDQKLNRFHHKIARYLTLCMLIIFSCFCCRLLTFFKINFFKKKFRKTIRVSNSLDPDQD